MRKKDQKKTFRRIRRIVGVSALCLGIAISLVPVNLYATGSAPADNLTVTVSDERAAVAGLTVQSSATALNFDQESTLRIKDSDGEAILALMNQKVSSASYDTNAFYRSDQMSAFSLGFYDEAGEKKEYGTLDLTLAVPEAFQREGYLEVLGISGDGKSLMYAKVEKSTEETKSITFVVSGSAVPSGEFMLLSHKEPVTRTDDQRTDTKNGAKSFAAIEKDLYVDRVLEVRTGGSKIKGLIDANGSYSYDGLSVFTMTLRDDQGTEITKATADFGKLSVSLALPDEMKLSEGKIKLFAVNADGTLNTELSEKTEEIDGVPFVAFQWDGSGEFAIAYFSSSRTESALKVIDHRTDCKSTAKTTVSAKTEYTGQLFLHIDPSEGEIIRPLIEANGTYEYTDISPFQLTMTDAETDGKVVSSPPLCTLTMVLPDHMDASKGRVYLLGVGADGKLNGSINPELTELSGETYLTLETGVMTEYAFLYQAGERYPVTTRPADDSISADAVTAQISNGSSTARYFVAKELLELEEKLLLPDGTDGADAASIEDEDEEQRLLYGQIRGSSEYGKAKEVNFYDFSLTDSDGKKVSDFGTCTVRLQLEDTMDPNKGKLQVLTIKTGSDNLDTGIGVTTEKSGEKQYLIFTASHFTPYAVVYTENDATGTSTGSSSGATASSSTTGAGETPGTGAVVPVIINDASTPQSPAATGTGTAAQGTATTAGDTGGKAVTADMPKTADATTYRNILVMILLVFGAMMLISSFRFEKTVRRKKSE